MIRYILLGLISFFSTANAAELVTSVECHMALADGKYFARSLEGVVRIEGSYQKGKRNGGFMFYSASGQKIIEVPYKQDKLAGIVRAWHYRNASDSAQPLKLLSEIHNGYIEGRYQTWYADGTARSNFVIDDGDIITGEVWNEEGLAIDIKAKADFLANDIEADFHYYDQLEQLLDAHQPSC